MLIGKVTVDHLVKALKHFQLAAHTAGGMIVELALRSNRVNTTCASSMSMFAPRQLRGRFAFNQLPVVRQRRPVHRVYPPAARHMPGSPNASAFRDEDLQQQPDRIFVHGQHCARRYRDSV